MKRLLGVVLVIVLACAGQSFAGLYWGNAPDVITDFNGNPVATSGDETPTAGAFAQLIRILSGSTPYDFVASGSGINTSFEAVMDTHFSGLYDPFPDDGTFQFQSVTILNNSSYNGSYYVRVFDAPQASLAAWNQGTNAPIPAAAQYYWQSAVYTYTHNETEASYFEFGSGQTLNPIAIPEPTTMLLMVGGFAGVMAIRRKRVA